MMEETPFLQMFVFCAPIKHLCGGLDRALVRGVVISRETMSMEIDARFPLPPSPGDLAVLEGRIAAEYGLSLVQIRPDYPKTAAPERKKTEQASGKSAGNLTR